MDEDKFLAPLHSTLEVTSHEAPEHFQKPVRTVDADRHWKSEKRVFGLRVTTFWLSLALAIVLVMALVGGAVGGVLASRSSSQQIVKSSSSSLPTASRTSSIASPSSTNTPSPTVIPSNKCPASNTTDFTAPLTGSRFLITCGVDWTEGFTAADGNGTVQDLVGIYSNSMENCIDGCASYNHNQGGTPCTAVSYTANMTEYWVLDQYANCFLKNKPGVNNVVDSITVAQLIQ